MTTFIVIALFLLLLLWSAFVGRGLPKPFSLRACQGTSWRRAFPSASKFEIREFLLVFVGAFALPDRQKLMLRPDDEILAIYRALYPSQWTPDALELEALANDVEKKYGLEFRRIWNEKLSLGELFALTQQHSHGMPVSPPNAFP
ncbi:hypothetical protein ACU8YE_18590 [Ralstonia sp. VS2407]|uniref:Uncharacterized protein n=1 Tax=Ralstonia wenshanensis TaxID=2842456 RepID=A0AAD2B5J3_9RALS|nr:hypothetical protein [Ralstonia wenshanensis]CAJ0700644.1 hypothetical protein LMG18091_03239 [Ralstonia wenshanensis]